jgi:murein DD-endopeptidase MepM/ murein hydrolase activator NlpD
MIRTLFQISLIVLLLPMSAHASLPVSSNVPGGVAIVRLGGVSAGTWPPQAWLGDRPVLVTSDRDQWVAVVGLPLDIAPGSHTLQVRTGLDWSMHDFVVEPKEYPEQRLTIKDKGKVQLSPENAARAAREIAVIKQLKLHWRDARDTDAAFILPAEGRLSGRFGLRRIFNGEPRAQHVGLDVAVPVGSPIVASSHGEVLAVDDYFFNGKTVFLDHGNGLITMYCHLDRIAVTPGDKVGRGQLLGLSGQSGRATGPHLHWSVVLNGAMVDPELFIQAERLADSE